MNYEETSSREVKDSHMLMGGNEHATLPTGVKSSSGRRVESVASVKACGKHHAVQLYPVLKSIRQKHTVVRDISFQMEPPPSTATKQHSTWHQMCLSSGGGVWICHLELHRDVTWQGSLWWGERPLKNLADRIVAYGTNIPHPNSLFEQLAARPAVRLYMVTEEEIRSILHHWR